MFKEVPDFWKSDLQTLDSMAQEYGAKQICVSAGGRPVWAFEYGQKQAITSRANYSSALGAKDIKAYMDTGDSIKKPVVILIGAIHGQETEGVAALLNLIFMLETGSDFGANFHDSLQEAAEGLRLVIVPVANPDGRARVVPSSMIGCTEKDLLYWGQGTWKDGSLCGWPGCKKVHPIKDHVDFLGGYFNDDGINLMHDNFFNPMARETSALIKLTSDEFADYVIQLHGGTNDKNMFIPTGFVPPEVTAEIRQLYEICDARAKQHSLEFDISAESKVFNLASAMHHASGAVCAIFESNQCVVDVEWGVKYSHEEIYLSHMILFEELFLRCSILGPKAALQSFLGHQPVHASAS